MSDNFLKMTQKSDWHGLTHDEQHRALFKKQKDLHNE